MNFGRHFSVKPASNAVLQCLLHSIWTPLKRRSVFFFVYRNFF
nr:MAG TPA: hypothetical protein [Caudoviricetes sp.]